MPWGMMIPPGGMPPVIGRNGIAAYGGGATSALSLSQQGGLFDGQPLPALQHQRVDMAPPQQLEQLQAAATSESEMVFAARAGGSREGADEFESCKSGSENVEGNASGGDDGGALDGNTRPRKKRYHRHTQHQIQELEAFFKECPHPDDKQRKELSRELGLEPLQVKFWFQNKRTQMKTHHERTENMQLRAENEKLRAENMRYKEALGSASCPNCGSPAALGEMSFDEHHLRIENARLREEIDRISSIAAKYVGKQPMPYDPDPAAQSRALLDLGIAGSSLSGPPPLGVPTEMYTVIMPGHSSYDKASVIELAVSAMEELVRMAQLNEPLWAPSADGSTETLNVDEYSRVFLGENSPKMVSPELRAEASRDTTVVIMSQINLVEMLMDVNQWSTIFSSIVSRAVPLEVLSTGVAGNYNGALQLMSADFQVPSPLVPTRESQFVRYCKMNQDGAWVVVDVSLDSLHPDAVLRCRRRPSGCIIQEMPNGYSKVTWIEHFEADDRSVNELYKPLVNSGLAFGAKRWVRTLERQCERLASAMATSIPAGDIGVITTPEGRRSVLKLAERMVLSFCNGLTASATNQWTTLSGSGPEDVRVMTRKSVDDPGRPPGIILNAATSFWLPVPPKRVFDFLRDDCTRNEWDILSNGGVVQEMAHIANGHDQGNCVSLLRVNSSNSNQSNMLILQESCTDATGSYVIYAPVDVVAMNVVLNGGEPDYVALLPSGFAILPDGPSGVGGNASGSLLTVAFQILVDSVPTAKLSLGSVATVNNLIACTVERIKGAVTVESSIR